MQTINEDYIKYRNLWMREFEHADPDRYRGLLSHIGKLPKQIEKRKFSLMKYDCRFLGEKYYIKPPGGFYKCLNEFNLKYYCNYKTCPMLFNRNGANE